MGTNYPLLCDWFLEFAAKGPNLFAQVPLGLLYNPQVPTSCTMVLFSRVNLVNI